MYGIKVGDIVYKPYTPSIVGKVISIKPADNEFDIRFIAQRLNGETFGGLAMNVNNFIELTEGHERKAKNGKEIIDKLNNMPGQNHD